MIIDLGDDYFNKLASRLHATKALATCPQIFQRMFYVGFSSYPLLHPPWTVRVTFASEALAGVDPGAAAAAVVAVGAVVAAAVTLQASGAGLCTPCCEGAVPCNGDNLSTLDRQTHILYRSKFK